MISNKVLVLIILWSSVYNMGPRCLDFERPRMLVICHRTDDIKFVPGNAIGNSLLSQDCKNDTAFNILY